MTVVAVSTAGGAVYRSSVIIARLLFRIPFIPSDTVLLPPSELLTPLSMGLSDLLTLLTRLAATSYSQLPGSYVSCFFLGGEGVSLFVVIESVDSFPDRPERLPGESGILDIETLLAALIRGGGRLQSKPKPLTLQDSEGR